MAKFIYEKHKIDIDLTGLSKQGAIGYDPGYVINLATFQAPYKKTIISKIELGDFYTLDALSFNTSPTQKMTIYHKEIWSYGTPYYIAPNDLKDRRTAGAFVENVIAEEGTFPDDGIHTDGFWYVKIKPAFPEIKLNVGGVLKTATAAKVVVDGQLRNITDVYIVVDGKLKKIK